MKVAKLLDLMMYAVDEVEVYDSWYSRTLEYRIISPETLVREYGDQTVASFWIYNGEDAEGLDITVLKIMFV